MLLGDELHASLAPAAYLHSLSLALKVCARPLQETMDWWEISKYAALMCFKLILKTVKKCYCQFSQRWHQLPEAACGITTTYLRQATGV